MTQSLVSVIICARNNRDIIGNCLQAIARQTYPNIECIVMDDASTDGMEGYIAAHFPATRVHRNATNRGPSINRNCAAASAQGEVFVFLDSDVELSHDWIEKAVELLESEPGVGIVAGKLLFAHRPDRIHSYGGALSAIGLGWDHLEMTEASAVREPLVTLWASSAAMAIRQTVFSAAGGFDETFFYGYEDSDLGWRVTLAGYKVLSSPNIEALHRTRHTVSRMGDLITFHSHKNRLRSVLKNHHWMTAIWSIPLYLAYVLVDTAAREPRLPKWRALTWNLAHLADTLRLRTRIQQESRSAPATIRHLLGGVLFPPQRLSERRRRMVNP